MKIIKNIGTLLIVSACSYLIGLPVGKFYTGLVDSDGGSLFIMYYGIAIFLFGFCLSYIFFLSLLFTSFGGKNKYIWLGILLVPAVLFELYFDLAHIYVPIALGLVGWLVGMGVEKLVMGMQKK